MITAFLLFFSNTVWGSAVFLFLAALWKIRSMKPEDLKTPLFRIICIISGLSILNFIVSLIVNGGETLNTSGGLIGDYPYALSMFISYIIAVTIQPKELKIFLYLIMIDVLVGVIEYSAGVSSFWVVDMSFDTKSEMLYYKRVCGLDTNSSVFALNMLYGLIITYILKPKYKLAYLCVLCVGLFISFNRSYLLASLPLLIYFFITLSRNYKFVRYIAVAAVLFFAYYIYQQYWDVLIEQFTRGGASSTTMVLSNRDVIWRDFMNFFYQHPILGNGSSKMWLSSGWHAHNSFIWVLASNGAIIALLYYYYTVRYITKYNWLPILCIIVGSLTQSTIYWGLSVADIFLFILILNNKSNNSLNGRLIS